MPKAARSAVQSGQCRQEGPEPSSVEPVQRVGLPAIDLAQYVTTQHAAQLLGVTPGRVAHLLMGKRLEGVKLGHDWLVRVSSVTDYHKTKSRRGRPTSQAPQLEEAS